MPQFRGHPIRSIFDDYCVRARNAMVDHAFHQIVTDQTDTVVETELLALVAQGVRSFNVFLTYDSLHVDDAQSVRVLANARRLKPT